MTESFILCRIFRFGLRTSSPNDACPPNYHRRVSVQDVNGDIHSPPSNKIDKTFLLRLRAIRIPNTTFTARE